MNLEHIIKNRKVADSGDDIEYTPAPTKDLSYIDTFLKVISNNNRLNITYSNEARVGYYTPALNKVVLPYYITKDRDVYILMGSHEISHVLHTPLEFLDNHDGTNSNKHPTVRGVKFNKVLMNCINIVEDIRIERLIRNKFPGFVAVYERGYTKLFYTLFNMAEDSWDKMHLGDRINHKAKLGKLSKHQLTTYEEGIFRYLKDTKDAIYYIIEGSVKFYKVDRFDNEIFFNIGRFVSIVIFMLVTQILSLEFAMKWLPLLFVASQFALIWPLSRLIQQNNELSPAKNRSSTGK